MNFIKKLFGLEPAPNFKELMAKKAIIIDVRTPNEYKSGHIDKSLNIPLNTINSAIGKLKKDQIIITCCASGMRSGNAKTILRNAGFEVYNGGGWTSLKNKI